MNLLSRDEFLSRPVPAGTVDLADGRQVRVRALSLEERMGDLFATDPALSKEEKRALLARLPARVVVLTMIDAAGERVLSDADEAAVGKLDERDIAPIVAKVMELSGIPWRSGTKEEEASAETPLGKDLPATGNGASHSASRSLLG